MKKHLLISAICIGLTTVFNLTNAQTTNYVLNFNGGNNYVDLGNAFGSNIRSIEFWFKPNINTWNRPLVIRAMNMAYKRGMDRLVGAIYFVRDHGVLHEIKTNDIFWDAGTWYHVCGTIDESTGMKLYINGILQSQTDPTCTNPIPSSGEITAIGTWGDAFVRNYNGQIDELRFWNRSLSQTEIQSKMCYWLTPANETGLVGYWKMNEGSGSTIIDATSGSNNGTVISATFIQDSLCFSGYFSGNEENNQTNTSIFPNPFSLQTTLWTSDQLQNAALYIVNVNGQTVKEIKNINGQTVILSRENLASGLYFARLTQDNQVIATFKIVITD
ncbi:MAG: T9SS type A sorting domain-containing protein [Crocinitomicaceae bacterium]|nr:T9SS type A sorting domain-containing protein [Crocinitomicaceae bacterium]